MISPFRSAISHAPRTRKPTPDDPCLAPGSKGRPHSDAKMSQVRRLIETTTYSYAEITRRTGVPTTTIARWNTNFKWARPAFAPRATDTVPRWRASIKLRRRMLAKRLYEMAERWVRELEAQPRADFAKLREALELLNLTKLAATRRNPAHRYRKHAELLTDPGARDRVIADLRAKGLDIARTPSEALADFVETCAPGPDPMRDPALRPRGRYSKRNREHARLLERE
jgi:hypothetical protein